MFFNGTMKFKVNVEFKNNQECHFTDMGQILYEPKLCLKILLASAQEVFYRKETAGKKKWLIDQDLIMQETEELEAEIKRTKGFTFKWFSYAQLRESFNMGKKLPDTE